MSDSLPPRPGSVPAEEHDLDALLSGETARVPGPLPPVAVVMAALRAAPRAGELDGETAARAAYRRVLLPDQGWPAPGGTATMLLPLASAPPRGGAARMRGRPGRQPRHGRQRSRPPVPALLGVAAAVAGVIAISCALTGLRGTSGQLGRSALATPGPAASSASRQGVDGGARKEPRPRPTPTAPVATRPAPAAAAGSSPPPGPASFCREYLAFAENPHASANLSAAAGGVTKWLIGAAGGQENISDYCAALVDGQARSAGPGLPAAPGPGNPAAGPRLPGGHVRPGLYRPPGQPLPAARSARTGWSARTGQG
jgi:hypothetical protein